MGMNAFGGFSFSKRSRLTPQERYRAKETVEKLKAAEAAQLALYPDHPDEVRQAFWYGVHQAREYGIALRSGDEDPFESALPTGDQVSVHEFRQALRTSVSQGDLTEKQADELTWDLVIKSLESNGQSLVELSEEILASKVYIPEAPRFFPPTEEDLADDFDHIRAGEDRLRVAANEASWEALKAHLDSTFQQVSTDAERLHQRNANRPLSIRPEFLGIAALLSSMPARFRKQTFGLWLLGVKEFARAPVIVSTTRDGTFTAELLNIPIPMSVPSAEPDNCAFILMWTSPETGCWQHQMPTTWGGLEIPKTLLDQDFGFLVEIAGSGNPHAAHLLSLVERNAPDTVGAAWDLSPVTQVFIEESITPPKEGKRDQWYEIVRKARATFGRNYDSEDLLKLMGLVCAAKTNELKSAWKHLLESPPNVPRFKTIIREIKRNEPEMVQEMTGDPEAIDRFMALITGT
jgi:hypothetical protein